MKLYKTTGEQDKVVTKTVWSGSLADASKARVAMKAEKLTNVGTAEVEVPTDKQGLLKYLNNA
jgi:hypothetical protein